LFVSDRRKNQLWCAFNRATTYEEWAKAGADLDRYYRIDEWSGVPQISRSEIAPLTLDLRKNTNKSSLYRWDYIDNRYHVLGEALKEGKIHDIVSLLQSGCVRNLADITNPNLYRHCFVGTKALIGDYILRYCQTIFDFETIHTHGHLVSADTASPIDAGDVMPRLYSPELQRAFNDGRCKLKTPEEKTGILQNLEVAFGRSMLVLQGGSIFGLCHLGVARALFHQRLLPPVIGGTGTGALIAALIGTHTDEELPGILDGSTINLRAFKPAADEADAGGAWTARLKTVLRRLERFYKLGYFLNAAMLHQCIEDNCGDVTFEEAFQRTGRILNIFVVPAGDEVPPVLNYLNAPNVVRTLPPVFPWIHPTIQRHPNP
jgi:TAG lipase / lysophosphatidylethanolamine acyltransferase